MARYKNVDGERVAMTAEEEAELEAQEAAENTASAIIARRSGIFQMLAQQRLDDFAATKNYDSCLSCCTYADSANAAFQAEAVYMISARDATWTTLYQILADVEAENRPIPDTFGDIEGELPVLAWP